MNKVKYGGNNGMNAALLFPREQLSASPGETLIASDTPTAGVPKLVKMDSVG